MALANAVLEEERRETSVEVVVLPEIVLVNSGEDSTAQWHDTIRQSIFHIFMRKRDSHGRTADDDDTLDPEYFALYRTDDPEWQRINKKIQEEQAKENELFASLSEDGREF